MNVLITGGYGFIGSHIAERFFKEGHRVFIIDNLFSGEKESVDFKHRAFIGDVTNEKCENFFKAHSFEAVIHCAAQTSADRSVEKPFEDSSTNILGLINMLNLSKKYGVKTFVFCSSAAVYSDNLQLPIKEEDKLDPLSPHGINKMNGEFYCRKWEEMYGLSSLIFRFSDVYGPRQHLSEESDAVSLYTSEFLKQEAVTIWGTGKQTRDFVYVSDVADAVYRGVISRLSGIYNVSANTQTSMEELIATLSKWKPHDSVEFLEISSDDAACIQLDNTELKKKLGWAPINSLDKGIKATLDYYESIPPKESGKEKATPSAMWSSHWVHLAENIVLFLMFYGLSLIALPAVEVIDFWMIYVLLAALLFGRTQAICSSFLAIAMLVNQAAVSGREPFSLIMDNNILATFIMYLLIGLVVSYVVDRREIELQFTKEELGSLEAQHSFLTTTYEETLEIKNELQQQILRSDNGIGQVYQAARLLNSLEPEALFSGTVQVLEQTLKATNFALYSVSLNGFARLVSKSGDPQFMPYASLTVTENPLLNEAVHRKQLIFNDSLLPSEPFFAAPIVQQNNTVAVIVCYDVKFQKLTLSYRNLVDVVVRLINEAFERSSKYMDEIKHLRYVEETMAMKPAYFKRILEQKQQAAETLGIPFTILYVNEEKISKEKLRSIGSAIRMTDYMGFTEGGKLCVVLSNLKPDQAGPVIERLNQKRIKAFVEGGELSYVG